MKTQMLTFLPMPVGWTELQNRTEELAVIETARDKNMDTLM